MVFELASGVVVLKVKEQLEFLLRGISGKINQTIQFSAVNTSVLTFPGLLAVIGTVAVGQADRQEK